LPRTGPASGWRPGTQAAVQDAQQRHSPTIKHGPVINLKRPHFSSDAPVHLHRRHRLGPATVGHRRQRPAPLLAFAPAKGPQARPLGAHPAQYADAIALYGAGPACLLHLAFGAHREAIEARRQPHDGDRVVGVIR
jgi:hypothetical protein